MICKKGVSPDVGISDNYYFLSTDNNHVIIVEGTTFLVYLHILFYTILFILYFLYYTTLSVRKNI